MKRTIKLLLLTVLGTWMAGSAWADEHYLVGGCTDSGWNTGENTRKTVAMMQVSDDVWVWCGKLTTGEGDNGRFKIPNGANNWEGYWAPAQGTILTSEWSDLSTNSDGDNKYCVAEEGYYKVTINTNTKQIKAEKLTEPTTKDGDYYLINSVADYYWFASAVISGQQSLKARLNADLDFSTDGFFPLGNDKDVDGNRTHNFKGEFDGQGHAMTGIVIKGDYNQLAPFRSIDGATIKNLKVAGVINSNSQFMGGMVSQSRGSSVIENVVVDMAMTSSHSGDGTHGGVIAVAWGTPTMKNIAVVGSINATNDDGTCGMIGYAHGGSSVNYTNCFIGGKLNLKSGNNRVFGRNGEYCTNCYTTITDMDKLNETDRFDGAVVTASQVASGELCFKLNESQSDNPVWFQTIGTDNMPSPFGTATVYAIGQLKCDGTPKGEVTYSNTYSESQRDNHDYNTWGFCTACNFQQPDFLTQENGYYLIGTKQQYNWFMYYVNNGHADANAKLTQDLDLSDYNFVSIGNDGNRYHGTFDGQGFRVMKMSIVGTTKELGFFGVCSNATIKNLIIDASCVINSGKCTAALVGCCNGPGTLLIENVGVECDVTGDGANVAAFVGCNYGATTINIKNCYNTGNIKGTNESAVFSGWFGNNSNAKVENCWSTGKVTGQDGQNSFGRGIGSGQFVNTYDLNSENNPIDATKLEGYDASWLASGQLTYIMNGKQSTNVAWYQTVGTDTHPMLFGSTDIVYANGKLKCDGITPAEGSALTFSNNEGNTIEEHTWGKTWGFCTFCDEINPDFMTATNGVYTVENDKQLNWLANYTGKINPNVNAVITADIDMDEVNGYPGFGSSLNHFSGSVDGQGHIIKNLVTETTGDAIGLISFASAPLTVKNLTIDASCSFKSKRSAGAFIGELRGNGDVTLEQLGNEANVTTTDQNAGGIVGCNFSGEAKIKMTNCYNAGAISSGWEAGGISGWLGDNAVLTNVYNMGSVNGNNGDKFARGNNQNKTNCNDNTANYTDGTVFAALFDAAPVWYMDFDATTPHPVLYKPATLVMKEDFPNRFVAGETANVKVYRAMTAADNVDNVEWNTLCLPFDLDGKTLFSAIAELTGFNGTTLQFTSASTIEAGKAYIVIPKNNITTIEADNVELKAAAPTVVTGYTFTGIYEPTLIPTNDLFVAAGNKLQPSDGTGKLKGFRAYFKNTTGSAARVLNFVVDDTTTGIIGIDGTVIENGKIYNLNGQKVQNAQKGLYIVNGKKVVVK